MPDDETLYGELSYLTKDPAEAAGYREPQQREPAIEPAKKKDNTILVHTHAESGFENFELTAATPQEANVWMNDLILLVSF